jgi:hypothetical protein
MGADPLDVYIQCSRLVAKSCAAYGVPYAVITNKPELLRHRAERLGGGSRFVLGHFSRSVPSNAAFYSAHFKLDVLRSFGEGKWGDFVGLVDLDVVLTRPLNLPTPDVRALYVYDLTSQEVRAYGVQLRESLRKLGMDLPPRWYGGEFIAGRSDAFRVLSRSVDQFWPAYSAHMEQLHHAGDEMVVTPALMDCAQRGIKLIDAGSSDCPGGPAIARWWSASTIHEQESFMSASRAAILHLPADKQFLAAAAEETFDSNRFISQYVRHTRPRALLRQLSEPLLRIRRGSAKFPPHLR